MAIGAPQFQQRLPLVDKEGRLSNEGLRALNDAFAQQQQLILSQQEIIEQLALVVGVDIPGLEAAAAAALAAADAANDAAAAAQGATEDNKRAANLANSYVDDPNPITATDAGANVTITIAAHNRIYGDGTSVAVAGGLLTGRPYNTVQYVYYDDPARAGGAVTYQTSADPLVAAQQDDRHSVGFAPAIASADPPATGGGVRPPGGSYYDTP